ncbi:MAG: WD40 repeat domain-containing protein [Verrucomicrobiales bacterium]
MFPLVLVGGFLLFLLWSQVIRPRVAASDLPEGALYTLRNGHRGVDAVGFFANGNFVTDGSAGGLVHAAADGSELAKLATGSANHRFRLAPDRSELAAFSTVSPEVRFFSPEGAPAGSWSLPEELRPLDLAWLPNIKCLAVASREGIDFFRRSDGSRATSLPDSAACSHLAASADGRWLVAYRFREARLSVWPLADIQQRVDFAGLEAPLFALAADGSRLAFRQQGRTVCYHLPMSDSPQPQVIEEDRPLSALSFDPTGQFLALGDAAGQVTVVDTSVKEGKAALVLGPWSHPRPIASLAFSVKGDRLLVGLNHEASAVQHRPGGIAHSRSVDVRPGYAVMWEIPK